MNKETIKEVINNAKQPTPKVEVPVIKEVAALPTEVAIGSWGAIESFQAEDLLIPKIYHQQTNSKFVSEGKARPGDFCDSLTGEVLAKKEGKLEIIIFGMFKYMVVSKHDKSFDSYKLDKIVKLTPENAVEWGSKPFLEEVGGIKYKNTLQYNYYCILPNKLNELPFILTLASTKAKVARKLNTMLSKLEQLRRAGASVVFEFTNMLDKNNRGAWFNLEVTQGRSATNEEITKAHEWYLKSKSQAFVAADEVSETDSDEEMPF